jgi:ABC-type transporter MlaC component
MRHDELDVVFDAAREALDAVRDTTYDSLCEAIALGRHTSRDAAAAQVESVFGAARTTLERSFAETLQSLDAASERTRSQLS